MSRIGRLPIKIPDKVKVSAQPGLVNVEGPKGKVSQKLDREMKVTVEGGQVKVDRPDDSRRARQLHGLSRTLVANMIQGVTVGFQRQPVLQWSGVDGVEAEPVEESHDLGDGESVVAGCSDRDAVGCSLRTLVLFELVVAELVEALDHSRGGEALLHDHAGAVWCGRELRVVAVDGLPVVRGVDEDLAGEQIAWELAEAVRGDGEDDDVGVAYDVCGRGRARAWGEHVDRERDVVGRARS